MPDNKGAERIVKFFAALNRAGVKQVQFSESMTVRTPHGFVIDLSHIAKAVELDG